MNKGFLEMLAIARDNISRNPSLVGRPTDDVALQYLGGLKDEVEEVRDEIRYRNEVYLEDELSDIAWDYACLLATLEAGGYIQNAEEVFEHGFQKYSERAPAFLETSNEQWEAVKRKQKIELTQRHEAKYDT